MAEAEDQRRRWVRFCKLVDGMTFLLLVQTMFGEISACLPQPVLLLLVALG